MQVTDINKFCGSNAEIDSDGVLFNGPKFQPTRRSTKVCRKPLATTENLGGTCDNLPTFALTYEMNFVYDFEHDSGKRPIMGDNFNQDVANNKFALVRSDFPKNLDTFGIVNEFASNQQVWAEQFLNGWEKIQNQVDYELAEDVTKMSWLGYSFFSKGKYRINIQD